MPFYKGELQFAPTGQSRILYHFLKLFGWIVYLYKNWLDAYGANTPQPLHIAKPVLA
ncbi:hypothetical protein [Moraxella lacunata]|uniref:hypothetical protein n=1 Tax=Moraxella lacunata TaxID=477 RepID=UPI003EDF108F